MGDIRGGRGGGGGGGGAGRRRGDAHAARDQQQRGDGQQDVQVPVSPLLRLSMSRQKGGEKDDGSATAAPPTISSERAEDGEIIQDTNEHGAMSSSPVKRQKMADGTATVSSTNVSSLLICRPTSPKNDDKNAQHSRNMNRNRLSGVRLDEPDWVAQQPPHLRRLVRAAADRQTTLLLMPKGMARRKENTTTHSPKHDVIHWRVELRFHLKVTPRATEDAGLVGSGADGSTRIACSKGTDEGPAVVTITVDGIPEVTSLVDILSAQLDVKPDGKNRAARSKLRALASLPRESLRILTKSLPCPASKPIYVELESDQNLTAALKGLTIVEFPILEVVTQQDLDAFPRRIEML